MFISTSKWEKLQPHPSNKNQVHQFKKGTTKNRGSEKLWRNGFSIKAKSVETSKAEQREHAFYRRFSI